MAKRKPTVQKKKAVRAVKSVVHPIVIQDLTYYRASIWRRFAGFLIDYLILGLPNSLLVWFMKDHGLYSPIAVYYNIFLIVLALSYFILLTWKNDGRTIGKTIVRTRVMGWKTALTLRSIIIRYGVLFVLVEFAALYRFFVGSSLGIGMVVLNALAILLVLILMIIDDEHRGAHDFAAGTWVVRNKSGQ